MLIEWTKAHPQYWNEPPVETEFRFLKEAEYQKGYKAGQQSQPKSQ